LGSPNLQSICGSRIIIIGIKYPRFVTTLQVARELGKETAANSPDGHEWDIGHIGRPV